MDWLRKTGGPFLIAGLTVLLIGVGLLIFRQQQPAPPLILDPTPGQPQSATRTPSTPTAEKLIKVYVSGAVTRPDVYTLLATARVKEAIDAAGGPTPDADLDRVNLAARLHDEMQILVPHKGQVLTPERSPAKSSIPTPSIENKLNINTASADQLEVLPGIGTVTAARIIDYRDKHGPFKSIDQLVQEKLITKTVFDRIKDVITAE